MPDDETGPVRGAESPTEHPDRHGAELHGAWSGLRAHLRRTILGQDALVERLLVALLAAGHLLVEGAPGLAKTTAIKTLASGVAARFHRVQFTPDLLPADLTGTEVYRPQEGTFAFQPGPLFHNLLLADEINRAPAKVQSALLEAMSERQITVGGTTHMLPRLFLVMATQNPIEQEGTYPLPEAQLDRFLLYVRVGYPPREVEREILHLARTQALEHGPGAPAGAEVITEAQVFAAREAVLETYLAPELEDYLIALVLATREPAPYGSELERWIRFGASPRATMALDRCARALAWLDGRDYVLPEDIQAIAHDVLQHRILISFEAQADGVDGAGVVEELLRRVAVP